jgi:hypothetical protein
MRDGYTDQAIACYEQSLAEDPRFAANHLSLAAAYLEKGEQARACPHLAQYLDACPDELRVRGHYAELLYRLKNYSEARIQYNRFVREAQEESGLAAQNLLHCHSRLMLIALEQDDPYAEHLHRGIGLLHLARARASLEDADGGPAREGLLCKAAAELILARQQQPDEARPSWYLYEVWSQLAQRQPALRSLHEADTAAPFSYLTPAEQRSLELACSSNLAERMRK